jgi:hydroxybutyrate-dimer hydrolase
MRPAARDDSNFTADIKEGERAAFNAHTPNRFAFKHAHSQQNPEKDWGDNVLASIKFAFDMLERQVPARSLQVQQAQHARDRVQRLERRRRLGARGRAGHEGLIDGLAVGEPNVNPKFKSSFSIKQGAGPAFFAHSKPLMDYITLVNVFQGCASLALAIADALNFAPSRRAAPTSRRRGCSPRRRSRSGDRSAGDHQRLRHPAGAEPGAAGLLVRQRRAVDLGDLRQHLWPLQRARQPVRLQLRGERGVPADLPVALAAANEAQIFGTSNGIPPTSGLALINNAAPGGPKEDRGSTPNQNLDGALCLRSLATAKDAVTGAALAGTPRAQARRIAEGVEDIRASGKLRRVPAVFVTGRNDGILPPNFTSRAYFGLNNVVDGSSSSLRYYEVTERAAPRHASTSSPAITTSTSRCIATSIRRWT